MQRPPPPGGPGFPQQPAAMQRAEHQCPRCRAMDVHKPSFTWWGGVLGPKIVDHWECRACGYGFIPRTGESSFKSIAMYTVGVVVVLGVIFAVLFLLLPRL